MSTDSPSNEHIPPGTFVPQETPALDHLPQEAAAEAQLQREPGIAETLAPDGPARADGVQYIETPEGAKDGLNRCSKCGASDVAFIAARGIFMCRFCRFEWTTASLDEAMGLSTGIGSLRGTTISTAAADITDDETLMTLKCSGCGAEVVIDTAHNLKARCHWCKSVLSINNRIPNGAVPDGILPFSVSKEQAMASIKAFAEERKSFALPAFAEAFRPENVMGVYLPYMTVDGNVSARLDGAGETLVRRIRTNNNQTIYKANAYRVVRSMDLEVDDVVVETSSSKANIRSEISTNNIINSVLPFDVKQIVRFNANFLGEEFTSERRDMDVDEAEGYAAQHFLTIARGAAAPTVSGYDRGVRWEAEQLHIHGSRWTAVLLPVWLYGFVENRKGQYITHYIAVNGRTGATMGSVPINRGKAAALAWGLAAGISVITWPLAFILMAAQ